MTLSLVSTKLVEDFIQLLRIEYKDGCRDRGDIDRHFEQLQEQLYHQVKSDERQQILAQLRPLRKGYRELPQRDRILTVVQIGQDLKKLLEGSRGPTEQRQYRRFKNPEPPKLKLTDSVQYLKGVGPKTGAKLETLEIYSVQDLLFYFPRRWEDRSIKNNTEWMSEAYVAFEGVLGRVRLSRLGARKTLLKAELEVSGKILELSWFNQEYLRNSLTSGSLVRVYGKLKYDYKKWEISSPDIEVASSNSTIHLGSITPIYPLTRGIREKWLRELQARVIPTYASQIIDPFPKPLRQKLNLIPIADALLQYHWPENFRQLELARERLAFDELFLAQVETMQKRNRRVISKRQLNYDLSLCQPKDFFPLLPFQPTSAQVKAMEDLTADLQRDFPMNRLLQGDVGTGKTIVAAYAAWCSWRQGYQSAIMAPTEILAEQHFLKLQELFSSTGMKVAKLHGSMRKKQKQAVYEALSNNEIDLLIGTHALIQEGVEFDTLGMVVVDEQHKFGVMQRTVLKQKGTHIIPDLLVMTATPIPRTLALTLRGELEFSRLDELPPGRHPITSSSIPFSQRKKVYEQIRQQVELGHQAYIVCPLVDKSEKIEATSAVEQVEHLQNVIFKDLRLGLLHGKMKAKEKEAVMNSFRNQEYDILVSTTVIEVGVDVPNATIMVIQDANRFGLAQLHQLRGRVGRGGHASYCIFMSGSQAKGPQRRLKAIARFSDGNDVAEEDLQIRGPGDFYGLRQSGFPEFQVADLLRDQDLIEKAVKVAQEIIRSDPDLTKLPGIKERIRLKNIDVSELIH